MAVATSHNQAGFTLVEVLCVLALLGLTAGLVVLNLPKPADPFETEVKTLAATLNLAARESVIDGRPRAVDLTPTGVEVFTYNGTQDVVWIEEGTRDFAAVTRIELSVEDERIDLRDRAKDKARLAKDDPDAVMTPLIHFDATGNVTPFRLELSDRGSDVAIVPDMRGRIVVENTR